MIVGAICARGGSKGVPRKNLRLLAGRPLIAHSIEQALSTRRLDRVVVSTDDEEIASVAKELGADVPFVRPAALAQDHSPKWTVFQHLLANLDPGGCGIEMLIDLDTGTPLRSQSDIEGSIDLLEGSEADVVITAYAAERNPYFNMVESNGDYVRIVKSTGGIVTRRQDAPQVFSLSPAVFSMKADFIMNASHWSEGRVKVYEIPRERAVDIDDELDFRFVECLLRQPRK